MTSNVFSPDFGDNGEHFDEPGFLAWMKSKAKKAGEKVVETALMASYVGVDSKTPPAVRALLFGALAYLVLPVDAVPDFIPVVGFADDLAALMAVLVAIAENIRVRHLRFAREQMNDMGMVIELVPVEWNDDARLSEYRDIRDDAEA